MVRENGNPGRELSLMLRVLTREGKVASIDIWEESFY